MTLEQCPFCGNESVQVHHNEASGITFMLCGDDVGKDGCGAVVSFRPNLIGSGAMRAYNRRHQAVDVVAIQRVINSIDLRAESRLDVQCKGWVEILTRAIGNAQADD